MELPEKIDKETKDGLFAWLLMSEGHGASEATLSDMVRELVRKHNDIIDYLENK